MSKIIKVFARQILDSRGNPTVEADIHTENNIMGRAAVPSGASTGKYEAVELRDKDSSKYLGKGVLNAVNNVNTIINDALIGLNVLDQELIDQTMINLDGTHNKSNLGANAILSASLAAANAGSKCVGKQIFNYFDDNACVLPVPMMNILNGGSHADNSIDFQEFMIMPISARSFSDALRVGSEIFSFLKKELQYNNHSINVGDEGGFAPNLGSNQEAIEIVIKSIKSAGYVPGKDVYIAIDAAASEFYDAEENMYIFNESTEDRLSSSALVDYWADWKNKYPIVSIEDGLHEDDWEGWKMFTEKCGNEIQLVGDDLFVTNVKRLEKGIKNSIANSILIKVNQIGTLTETISAVRMAQDHSYTAVMSHRSGETEDTIIADLSVGLNTGQIKTGSLSRSDRVAKYNRLLRIEELLQDKAVYAGETFEFLRI